MSASWQGPLPPPSVLKEYEIAFPGLGERLISTVEVEGAHRRGQETKALDAQIGLSHGDQAERKRGQWMGFGIGVFVILIGAGLVLLGHPVPGSLLSVSAVAGLAGVFVHGRRSEQPPTQQDTNGE